MLTQPLLELAAQMAPSISTWPRRQPGLLVVDGKVSRYADLHSLYHQIRQLFSDDLYGFRAAHPAPVILDCGAHVGLASLYFKERYPAARIKAFEADAALADMTRANLATFGAGDVEVIHAAVWTHDDGVSFAHSDDDAGHVSESSSTPKVPSVRLKTVLRETPVDFLKLDVEGAEFALFEDCGDALARVNALIMEVHALEGAQAHIGSLLAQLERLGFRYVLGDLHPATWLTPETPPPFACCAQGRVCRLRSRPTRPQSRSRQRLCRASYYPENRRRP